MAEEGVEDRQVWDGGGQGELVEKGILDIYDAADVIRDIKYNLRRYELKRRDDGSDEWVPPEKEYKHFHITKGKINEVWGNYQTFLTELQEKGGEIEEELTESIKFKERVNEIKPLVNRVGEHDILGLLRAFLNKNIYMSSLPGRGTDKFVYLMTNKFAHDLITLLGVNANKYGIQEPQHLKVIIWIVVPNVFAALQRAVEAGGRKTLEKIMGETRVIQERFEREAD